MRIVALSLAAALAVAATPALAAGDAGLYAGIAVTHDNVSGTDRNQDFGMNGVGGSVFAGYNFNLTSSAFAGLEANFDVSSADSRRDRVKLNHAYGVSGRLGFRMSDSAALYGRVGYQRSKVTISNFGGSFGVGQDGLRLGAGVEANVSSNVALRVEYNHNHYYDSRPGWRSNARSNNQAAVGVVFGF